MPAIGSRVSQAGPIGSTSRWSADVGKIALIFLLVLAAMIWLRIKARRESANEASRPAGKSEIMLTCAHCGIHLPSSEAMTDRAGRTFCCAEHRDAQARAS
jgi:uncharacterized protein